MKRGHLLYGPPSLLLLLVVFNSVIGQNCPFEVQPCDSGTLSGDSATADYGIATTNNPNQTTQNICFSTATTQYNASNVTVRIFPANINNSTRNGAYCTNILLDASQACSMNTTGSNSMSVMYFDLQSFLNDTGNVSVTFLENGILIASIELIYSPDGIYPLNSNVTVDPGNPLNIQWTVYSPVPVNYLHFGENGMLTSPRAPGVFINNYIDCILPDVNSFISPSRPNISSVSISTVNFDDSGSFLLYSSLERSLIRVNVRVPSQPPVLVTSNSSTIMVQMGSTISILCDIQWSSDSPNWYFQNVPINSTNVLISSTILTIVDATLSLSGEYICSASNEYGRTEKSFFVIVGRSPSIIIGPADILVQNNSRVVLPCTATGLPIPNVQWIDSNMQLLSDGVNGVMIDNTSGAISFIANGSKNVSCRVFNNRGSKTSNSVRVTVIDNTGAVQSSPLTHITGSNTIPSTEPFITLSNNDFAELTCYNSSNTENFRYSWFKDNQQIQNVSSFTYTVTSDANGTTWGHYCCQIHDPKLNQTILDTRCVVITVRVKAELQYGVIDTSIQSGSSVAYYCLANTSNGIDLPVLSWYKNGVRLNETGPRFTYFQDVVGLTTLQILNISTNDAGVYTCNGTNFVSSVSSSGTIIVTGLCGNNTLSSSTAEENINTIRIHWTHNSLQTTVITQVNGEKHFILEPSIMLPDPYISQSIYLMSNYNYTINFSGRMRTSNSDQTQPVFNLTVPGLTSNILELPFGSLESWQWVSTSFSVSTDSLSSSSQLLVSMQVVQLSSNDSGQVYFDDLCVELTSQALTVASTTNIPPTLTPTRPDPVSLLPIILPSVLGPCLIILFVCVCICCCCCYRRKKRNKQINSPDVLTYRKKNGTELVGLVGPKKYDTPTSVDTLPQPVYILPGETPIYLDTSSSTTESKTKFPRRMESPLRSSEELSYSYPTTTQIRTSVLLNNGNSSQTTPEEMYDDPNRPVYNNLNKDLSEEGIYDNEVQEDYEIPLAKSYMPVQTKQASRVTALPLPPLPTNTHIPELEVSNDYMSLNPTSLNKRTIYASASSLVKDPAEDENEYSSIRNEDKERIARFSRNIDTEEEYI